jgi:Glycosyltransferase family 87
MAQQDRRWLHVLLTLYAFLALAWLAFARWVVPPVLIAEHSPGILATLKRYIELPPALFLTWDILGRWREYSGAVLIAIVLHLTIILILRRYDHRASLSLPATVLRAERRVSLALLIISFVFLGVTALSGPRHDYYFYRQMWFEISLGHDPWFKVYGLDGHVPLNAYGPLFNLLTPLSWLNPYAPKLLFAYSYTLFAISQIKTFTASRTLSVIRLIALLALFWNPFPWVEIAVRGHFDFLVGLFCLGAIRAWARGYDIRSGVCLALGVLLKYLPIVLLPVLLMDRGRTRWRFLFVAVATIAVGMELSCLVWGMSTLSPLELAATRDAKPLSIFFFLRGEYSPLHRLGVWADFDDLAPCILFLALMAAWAWSWLRQPDVEAAALVAAVTTMLFYRTLYPQYQMVPFVLGSSWAVRHWGLIKGRTSQVVPIACYFGWLALFDFYYAFDDEGTRSRYWQVTQYVVGLPSFLFGCSFLFGVIHTATTDAVGERNNAQPGPPPPG